MLRLKMPVYAILILLLFNLTVFAQQDYNTVKKFKESLQEIELAIKDADSLYQLDNIEIQIDNLEKKYSVMKTLLDKSLYPDDFNISIAKLRKELFTRKGDFTKITILTTEVSELTLQLEQLNEQNLELISKVQTLTETSKSDHQKISQLQKSIASLRISLKKRDELVISILDNLLPSGFTSVGNLSPNEKQKIISKAGKTNIIDNIENAIDENIKFLQVTDLDPGDIEAMNDKRQKFKNTWENIGGKISEVYSAKGKSIYNLTKIGSSFAKWKTAINMAAWKSINNSFVNNGINLNRFSNGNEFTGVIKTFITNEIENEELETESPGNKYETFADSVWFGNVKPDWVPFLIENNLLTEAQKDTIEANIARWKDVAEPTTLRSWIYIFAGILILIIIFLVARKNTNKRSVNNMPDE